MPPATSSLGANIFYTLASVPLALHYLGKPEFGLWALVMQIGGYIALIDFGMANSVSRFLIDHKDDRSNGAYGGVIKTSVLVGLAQGGLIMLAGVGLSLLAGPLLHMPADLERKFSWLMIGQSLLTGLSFRHAGVRLSADGASATGHPQLRLDVAVLLNLGRACGRAWRRAGASIVFWSGRR